MHTYEICRNCRYWKTAFGSHWGICHRIEPTYEDYAWTYAHGYCDEFCDVGKVDRRKGLMA